MSTYAPTPVHSPEAPHETLDGELEDLAVAAEDTSSAALRARLHEDMIVLALPFADGIARRYMGRGIETDDLIQVARTGLVKAVRRYRPSRGCAFAAFATPTISGELKRWFRDHGWSVRPPRRVQELRQRVGVEEERLQRILSRPATEGSWRPRWA
jgi:RNA polymerase sigma-B factor